MAFFCPSSSGKTTPHQRHATSMSEVWGLALYTCEQLLFLNVQPGPVFYFIASHKKLI
jgi:hypothetical protein